MKVSRTICLVAALFSSSGALAQAHGLRARGRQTRGSAAPLFEPLARWKSAIENRDNSALEALYSTNPPAREQTPQGIARSSNEEPRFWEALESDGLTDFDPRPLEIQRPRPDAVALTLRVEMRLRAKTGMQPFVVSEAQLWIKQGGAWRIIQTQRGDPAPNPPMQLPQPAKPNVSLYPPPREAGAEIAAALHAAEKDHKRVILVFGANWCYDCHVLDATFRSPRIAPLVNANYHVVHVNIGDGDRNLDLADEYGVPLRQSVRVPSLAVLDASGKVVYSQKNGEFDDSARLSPADIIQFLKKWAPPHHG